jgi:hypothetical protein
MAKTKIRKFIVNGKEAQVSETALEGQLLPAATAADEGKVPTVQSDGSYGLENGGGSGGGVFVVTCEASIVDEQPVFGSASKSATEILEAVNNNVFPILFVHGETEEGLLTMTAVYITYGELAGGMKTANFAVISSDSSITEIYVDESKNVRMHQNADH